MRRGVDAALNAGQFLTGWAKPVNLMLEELTAQEQEQGAGGATARSRAERGEYAPF
jgi:hypothetical protein